jgi:hypothetical protein
LIQRTLFDTGPEFVNRSTKAITFQGKLDLPIHRWYRLTPSFSPRLAADIADHFQLGPSDQVLDPFSGVGTVPLSMKYRGIPACSVELNPYLHFVGTVKTRTYAEIGDIERRFEEFMREFKATLKAVPFETKPDEYLSKEADFIPKISTPERWWSAGNLAQLVCLRKFVLDRKDNTLTGDLLRMGVLAILVVVSNAKHNHVSLTFADKPRPTVDVAGVLERQLLNMVSDLKAISTLPCAETTIYRGNSKSLSAVLPKEFRAAAVITSPPYPNRFSYARETRPHLFYFDFIRGAKEVGEMELDAIGGTWGKATSVLAAGVAPINECVRKVLDPYVHGINTKGNLMASYVIKYFNDLYLHGEQLEKVTAPGCKLAYVIGNSKFYDEPLPSDKILASLFDYFGFQLDRIDKMRKRQSKTGLYEAVVFMRKA